VVVFERMGQTLLVGANVDSVYCFEITAWNARACLQGLRHEPRTPLLEHAPKVTCGDMSVANRKMLNFEAFSQSSNSLGPHHHLLAASVTNVEEALKYEMAYFQASNVHGQRLSTHQVDAEDRNVTSNLVPVAQREATTSATPVPTESSLMLELVQDSLVEVKHFRQIKTTGCPQRSWRTLLKCIPPHAEDVAVRDTFAKIVSTTGDNC